jgi:cell fate regulator YaaT (PSP1 superfamily)
VRSYYVRYGALRRVRVGAPGSDDFAPQRGSACVLTENGHRWFGTVLTPTRSGEAILDEGLCEIRSLNELELEDWGKESSRCESLLDMLKGIAKELNSGLELLRLEQSLDGGLTRVFYSCREATPMAAVASRWAEDHSGQLDWVQVGARVKAKLCGGIAVCGREYCCTTVLRELTPVTMRMARAEGRSLLPEQTAGACGRLKCCLRYEYEDLEDLVTQSGTVIASRRMSGRVISVAEPGRSVWVENDRGLRREIFLKEILQVNGKSRGNSR